VGYDWDALGQLVSVRSEETTITYAYGITGMRELVSVETSGAATSWTKSVWDGSQLAAELDSDGTRYTYVWGPERTPLALEVTRSGQAAVTYAYHTDAFGSVVAITSPSGAVVASYAYDPYGAVTQVGGSDAALAARNPLWYRAYYHDTATGHYYLPARYYDPDTMRFLSPDPAPPSAGDPLTLNRYAYCVGDPVDMSDPTGEIADIWREHPRGVTVGMKVMATVAAAKRSGATGWDASCLKHHHRVMAQVIANPGSVRPSYTMTTTGWKKPEGYDSWQTEWLRARGLYGFFDRPGKTSLDPTPRDEQDIAADALSLSCSITAAGIQTGAEAGTGLTGAAALAASGPAAVVVAFAFLDAAAWTTAYSVGSSAGDYLFGDASLADAVLAVPSMIGLAYAVPGK
jgi:RHS repeat-associated protein